MASRIDADLIVMGAPRTSNDGADGSGDTIGGLIHRSKIPIMVVPRFNTPPPRHRSIHRLVLPLTNGFHPHAIFTLISSFAHEYEASVILVPVEGLSDPDGVDLAWEQMRHEGIESSIVRHSGAAARVVLDTARSEDADLICVPSFQSGPPPPKGTEPLETEIVKWSPLPVLLMPYKAL
jgi:nucleotide-binding universal stress UspA family protein